MIQIQYGGVSPGPKLLSVGQAFLEQLMFDSKGPVREATQIIQFSAWKSPFNNESDKQHRQLLFRTRTTKRAMQIRNNTSVRLN